jgi:RNA polymerase-binding transcription factor DksA
METARERLVAERDRARRRLAELTGDFREIVEASSDTNADDEHDPEGATIAFERSQVATLTRQTAHRIEEIDAALVRLDEDRYGTCERCGRPIPAERLEVRPTARTCVTC